MPTINLWATDGYISTPDGNSIYIWGFADNPGKEAQLPGPTLIVKQEAPHVETTITVNLTNNLSEPVSLVFPGQKKVTVNDTPVQPQYQNGTLVSFTNYAMPGETISYTVIVDSPGTFLYESATFPDKQVQMGMYGAMIVRPWDYDPKYSQYQTAYGAGTGTEFDREYLLIISEIDPELHKAVKLNNPFNFKTFKPRYWTINGRCAVDTMLPDNVEELPNQPYGAMIMMEPEEKILLRYAGAGYDNHPLHPHGNHTRLIGLDGRLLQNKKKGGSDDLSYKRFTVLTGAGQTYDQIYTWTGLGFDPGNDPIPTTIPNVRNLGLGHADWTLWSGSAYLGEKKELPQGILSNNKVGEYYFMLHSHSELEITNWGTYPGGMMTMIAVYPGGTLDAGAGSLPLVSYIP